MKRINADNKIFYSEEFQKDKYKFYLIMQNLKSESVVLYSDEENYVVCRGVVGMPTWIWTKDGFDTSKLEEIEQVIELYLTDADRNKFTCKKELYDLLVQDGYDKLNMDEYFQMGTLYCREAKKPKKCDGRMDVPSVADKPILVKYWYDDCQEMKGIDSITWEQAERDVQIMLDSQRFYVWRNDNDKIVCMASYNETSTEAKLSHAYTPIEERSKGYAANLIYSLTSKLLEKKLVPLLYTDYNYEPSNRAYKNAGYEDTGILINFSCSKKRKLNKGI